MMNAMFDSAGTNLRYITVLLPPSDQTVNYKFGPRPKYGDKNIPNVKYKNKLGWHSKVGQLEMGNKIF